jgi:amidase
MGTEGPMARSVTDLARLLAIQAGGDPRVPLAQSGGWPGGPLDLTLDVRRVRVAWLGDLDGHLTFEPGILDTCQSALSRLEAGGCAVEAVRPPFDPALAWQTWLTWRRWQVAATLREYWDDPVRREQLKPAAIWEAEQGERLSARDIQQASAQRSRFYLQLLSLFERFDYLALPSAQVWPFDATIDWPREIAGRPMDTYHRWMEVVIYATLAGLPAVNVPAGFSASGLPMGVQLIARPQDDLAALRVAHALELLSPDVLQRKPAALTTGP